MFGRSADLQKQAFYQSKPKTNPAGAAHPHPTPRPAKLASPRVDVPHALETPAMRKGEINVWSNR